MNTDTLPPPTEAHKSHTAINFIDGSFAAGHAMRLGDQFEATVCGGGFVRLTMTEHRPDEEFPRQIVFGIHRDGIPALIAELQRLTT